MRKEVAKQWVKALRSKKYKQGKGFLRNDDNSFCCLGVLCEVYQANAKKNKKAGLDCILLDDADDGLGVYEYDGESEVLPDKVAKWAGLKSPTAHFVSIEQEDLSKAWKNVYSLSDANDNHKKSFTHIADFIEKNYDAL